MAKTILTIDCAKSWSWGIILTDMVQLLPQYKFLRMTRMGMPTHRFPAHCPNCQKNHPVQLPKLEWKVPQDLVDHFDLTFLQNVEIIAAVPAARNKVIARIGGMVMDTENASPYRYDNDLKTVGAVVATNDSLFEIAQRCNPNSFLLPNGIDLDLFKPPDPCPNFDRPFTVGFAGNIWGMGLNYKGYHLYVQAVNHIQLFNQIKHRQLLHAHNQIDHDKMPSEFYHQIDALVLPSMGEGCSNVVMEALACGVPVICTRVGYHGDRLTNGENVLFIDRDVDDIVAKIMQLKESQPLRQRLSFNGRVFAENYHNIADIASEYDKIFQDVLERI